MTDPNPTSPLAERSTGNLLRAGWRAFTRQPGVAISLYLQSVLYSLLLSVGWLAVVGLALAPFYRQIVARPAETEITLYTSVVIYGMLLVAIFLESVLAAGTQYAFYKLVGGKERPTGRDVRAGFRTLRSSWRAFALTGAVVALPALIALLLLGALLLLWTRHPDFVLSRGELVTGGGLLGLVVLTATLIAMAGTVLVPIFVLDRGMGARESLRSSWRGMEGEKRRWVLTMVVLGISASVLAWIPVINLIVILVARCWMLCTASVLQHQILDNPAVARHTSAS